MQTRSPDGQVSPVRFGAVVFPKGIYSTQENNMNDPYNDTLSWEDSQRLAYWECVEEDRPEELEELVDTPLSDETLQWLYNQV